MKKALIIANEFPPMGGSGVQRSSKFVKYLWGYNIEPVVITKAYKGTLIDESLLKEIPDQTEIHTLRPYDLSHHKGLLKLPMKVIGRFLMIPDTEYLWQRFNRKKVLKLLDRQNIECIYTTSFPYSSHLMGLYLKKKRPHIRWVVDFRDEWTNNPYYDDMPWMRFRLPIEKRQEKKVCHACDFFITNTPFMLKNFLKDYAVLKNKSTFIPNGFDPDDFKPYENVKSDSQKFVVTYTGSLYGRRNLIEFFTAAHCCIEKGQIDPDLLEVRIVGNISSEVLEGFKTDYPAIKNVIAYGYMSHHESVQKLFQSNILLLSMGSGKGLENFYSGKIFEYIRVNRPILATVPEFGAAASVIRETGTGIVVDSANVDGIEAALIQYYQQWKNGGIIHEPSWDAIEKYSRVQQTKQLSEILNAPNSNKK